jgi:hypothetical protein
LKLHRARNLLMRQRTQLINALSAVRFFSLQRLGVDSLDVAFVHNISPDFAYFPNGWEEQYEIGRKGAFPAPVEDARRGHHTGLGHRRESVLPPTCQKYLFSWWVSSYRSALSAYCSL